MPSNLTAEEIIALAEAKISDFYDRRIDAIKSLDISSVLKRKNPYLYKALGFNTAEEIVRELLIAHSISSYEGIFGDAFFEPLAEAICEGEVSDADGVDITKRTDNMFRAYAIKSGTNVFNASSRKDQNKSFQMLRGRIQKRNIAFDAVVGYGYGNKTSNGGSSNFREVSGQALWKELSEKEDCYLDIAKFSNEVVAKKRVEFNLEFENLIKKSIIDFSNMFCVNGIIDWEKWIKYNSAIKCKKLNIIATKKTITESEDVDLEIMSELEDGEQYLIDTNNNELVINYENKNIEVKDNKIFIISSITEKEIVKIIFSYRHKSKTLNINIKPKKEKK